MSSQELAQKVHETIKEWSATVPKLVVGIDGYTGIGKTTLLNNLVSLDPNILAVNRDDFQISKSEFEKLYKNTADRSRIFELEMNDSAKLEKLIQTFRTSNEPYQIQAYDGTTGELSIPKTFDLSKRVMVVEGVFMFHPKLLNSIWDRRIYLKGDIDRIDERRIKREKERWGEKYFPETHPDSYFRQVIIALKRYAELYKPETKVDLVLDVD